MKRQNLDFSSNAFAMSILAKSYWSKKAVGVALAIASSTASPTADFDENKQ